MDILETLKQNEEFAKLLKETEAKSVENPVTKEVLQKYSEEIVKDYTLYSNEKSIAKGRAIYESGLIFFPYENKKEHALVCLVSSKDGERLHVVKLVKSGGFLVPTCDCDILAGHRYCKHVMAFLNYLWDIYK